jgi:hypothetical protein
MSCNFLFVFSHSHSHFARVLGEVGRMPRRSRNYCVIYRSSTSIIDHRVAVDQSPDRSTDTYTQTRGAQAIIAAGSCSPPSFLSCEFDPDLFVKLVRRWLVAGAVVRCCLRRAVTPCGSCRSVRGGGGARQLSTSVRPFRSTESFHSTKLSTTIIADRYLRRGPHIHTDKHPPARPVYQYN